MRCKRHNRSVMHRPLFLAALLFFSAACGAQALRCEDAADAQPSNGLTIIDPHAGDRAEAQQRACEQQRRDEADRAAAEALYPYPGDPGYGRPTARPRDMRPRIRNCGPSGCQDSLGNHYDPTGRLDRYVRPDGRSCRPIGTTVVCQ